jgi:hypothetical protein
MDSAQQILALMPTQLWRASAVLRQAIEALLY